MAPGGRAERAEVGARAGTPASAIYDLGAGRAASGWRRPSRPQPVLAVVGMAARSPSTPCAAPGPVIVCVDVRDPGNLGTVLRSAEAAGAAGVVCCDGTVDVYNPKCVRASAGALFHVPVVARRRRR